MIAAAAGAELGPGAILLLFRYAADGPIGVHDVVLAAMLEAGADAEARFRLDGAREAILLLLKIPRGNIQHGHFHAAGDVDADRIGNHGVFRSEHTADGQAIA